MSTTRLIGLPADNPLGFMAAVGALVVADRLLRAEGPVTLAWRAEAGA